MKIREYAAGTNYARDGQIVRGKYFGKVNFVGIVKESRVKYGGKVQHFVELAAPIEVNGRIRNEVLVEEDEIYEAKWSKD